MYQIFLTASLVVLLLMLISLIFIYLKPMWKTDEIEFFFYDDKIPLFIVINIILIAATGWLLYSESSTPPGTPQSTVTVNDASQSSR